jgi:hypothetical protein
MIGPLRDMWLRLRNIDQNRPASRISNELVTLPRYLQPFALRSSGSVIPKMNRTTRASRLRPPTHIIDWLARRNKPWETFYHYTLQALIALFSKTIAVYQVIMIRRLHL